MKLARADASLLDQLLIVPEVHVRLTDLDLQLEMYELFHQRGPTQVVHALCTPVVVALTGAMLSAVPLGATGLTAAAPYWALLALYHLALHPAVALALAPAYLLMAFAGARLAQAAPAPWIAAALAVAVGVQTSSHMFEAVPPPVSGTAGFVPLGRWVRDVPRGRLAAVALASALVFTGLEFFASFRVIALQALRGLFALGYRADLRDRSVAAARAHLSGEA